ncbi:MAG: HNH endonuclease signature motif containing protein [Ilumatobacter sp.]
MARLRHPAPIGEVRTEAALRAALCDIEAIRSWASAAEAKIVSELRSVSSLPEASIAEATRSTISAASRTRERSVTLEHAEGFEGALVSGAIVTGHVDELTRAAKRLDHEAQRDELFERSATLLADAERSTVEQFRATLAQEVKSIQRDDGMGRLERQKRATTMSSWTDTDGMWNLRARFDPLTGVRLSSAIRRAVDALFAEQAPPTCPGDPVEKQEHLGALALARLIEGDRTVVRAGTAEFVAVIDVDQPNGNGEPTVDWGIPVEVPMRAVAELVDPRQATATAVVVRHGVVVYAPGEMNLGRGARHASRDQRRALRALYRTCAVPGCATHFDRCKIHHIVWWSNGGLTDLENLLPVCVHHHHEIHDSGWGVRLGPQRRLTITLPDGTVMTAGPPSRLAG